MASMTSGLWPYFDALARTMALIALVILISMVLGICSTPMPPGDTIMGAAAPITLSGAMNIFSVATEMKAPADRALVFTQVTFCPGNRPITLINSSVVSTLPPQVSMSMTRASAPAEIASLTPRRTT